MDVSASFFDLLFPAGLTGGIEIRVILDEAKAIRFFADYAKAEEFAIASARDGNVLFGCGLRTGRSGRGGAGTADDVQVLTFAWVDLDPPERTEVDDDVRAGHRAMLLDRLRSFSHPPSLIVDSGGGGFHAYWRLKEPAPADAVMQIVEWLQRELRGDPMVAKRGAMLRVPGTINHKRSGRVQVVDVTEHSYALSDFPVPNHPAGALEASESSPCEKREIDQALLDVVEKYGSNTRRSATKVELRCPVGVHRHGDRNRSAVVFGDSGVLHCSSCGIDMPLKEWSRLVDWPLPLGRSSRQGLGGSVIRSPRIAVQEGRAIATATGTGTQRSATKAAIAAVSARPKLDKEARVRNMFSRLVKNALTPPELNAGLRAQGGWVFRVFWANVALDQLASVDGRGQFLWMPEAVASLFGYAPTESGAYAGVILDRIRKAQRALEISVSLRWSKKDRSEPAPIAAWLGKRWVPTAEKKRTAVNIYRLHPKIHNQIVGESKAFTIVHRDMLRIRDADALLIAVYAQWHRQERRRENETEYFIRDLARDAGAEWNEPAFRANPGRYLGDYAAKFAGTEPHIGIRVESTGSVFVSPPKPGGGPYSFPVSVPGVLHVLGTKRESPPRINPAETFPDPVQTFSGRVVG